MNFTIFKKMTPIRVYDCKNKKIIYNNGYKYATISYRWGDNKTCKSWKFKMDMKDKTVTSISLEKLKILSDLILKINIQYIWIDALCIDQENNNEKIEEINKMWKIYKNSICVIAVPILGYDVFDKNNYKKYIIDWANRTWIFQEWSSNANRSILINIKKEIKPNQYKNIISKINDLAIVKYDNKLFDEQIDNNDPRGYNALFVKNTDENYLLYCLRLGQLGNCTIQADRIVAFLNMANINYKPNIRYIDYEEAIRWFVSISNNNQLAYILCVSPTNIQNSKWIPGLYKWNRWGINALYNFKMDKVVNLILIQDYLIIEGYLYNYHGKWKDGSTIGSWGYILDGQNGTGLGMSDIFLPILLANNYYHGIFLNKELNEKVGIGAIHLNNLIKLEKYKFKLKC